MDKLVSSRIRTLIVDDEQFGRASIRCLLEADADIEIVGESTSAQNAVLAVKELMPDLLFLDVEMPEGDGFSVLESLGVSMPPTVIFVTAHEEYAIRAFEEDALDYLLKPFSDDRFLKAVEKAKTFLRRHTPLAARILVKSAGRWDVIRIQDIDWIEAADYYACLHVRGNRFMYRRTLSELIAELPDGMFCRVHRSAIVNMRCVSQLRFDRNGDPEIVLQTGGLLRVSRRYKDLFLVLLEQNAGNG